MSIAVVGRACLLPGANTPDTLWKRVLNKERCFSESTLERWGVSPSVLQASCDDVSATTLGGYVEGFDKLFDPVGFLKTPDNIHNQDTATKWLLHVGRQAFQEAKYDIKRLQKTRSGAIIGNLSYPSKELSDYATQVWLRAQGPAKIGQSRYQALLQHPINPMHRFTSGYPVSYMANAMGLSGDAFAIDAACASSIYALKLACDKLQSGYADVMLAGGINVSDDLVIHLGFTALQALSKTGQSRPFHPEADGLIPTQGVSVFVLKRLSDAVADKDNILGVIRGIGLSNDGSNGGFIAPSVAGQVRALRAAYDVSGVCPSTVSWLECHATGTSVGDALELKSISKIFKNNNNLHLGTLKANIGHSITASAGAALLNVLSGLAHKIKPPAVFAARIEASFSLLDKAIPWEVPKNGVRRAGINGFGFGGNNAHLIVDEWTGSEKTLVSVIKPKAVDIAIVALDVKVGNLDGFDEFAKALKNNEAIEEHAFADITLPVKTMRFPPNDLDKTLAQQLIVLQMVDRQLSSMKPLGINKTSVIIGMQTDEHISRYALKWRLPELFPEKDSHWIAKQQSALMPPLAAAHIIGCMPNVVANRLNVQYNFQGPSFSVSGEAFSGIRSLEIAINALSQHEVDTTIIGAVDLANALVQTTATHDGLGIQMPTTDAAVILVLKRLDDAKAAGDTILHVISNKTSLVLDQAPIECLLGYSHAAQALLAFVASISTELPTALPRKQTVTKTYKAHFDPIVFPAYIEEQASVPLKRFTEKFLPTIVTDYFANTQTSECALEEGSVATAHLAFMTEQTRAHHHFMTCMQTPFMQLDKALEIPKPFAEPLLPGPKFSREDLEVLACGKISTKFGQWFEPLDHYKRLIRMPEPPLLLADRVMGIDAEPGSKECGTIWTETDVTADAWYCHHGRMPAGIMIESGQADLLLISWLGFDFYNRGERIYRLLGCELTYYEGLPVPGETLSYDIHVDGHARQGDIRLFFFHYNCHVNGQRRMKVRNGQAGFFTDKELDESGGVLWQPEDNEYDCDAVMDEITLPKEIKQLSKAQLQAFSNGDAYACFGEGFEFTQTHSRTPCIASGNMLFLDEVTDFDVTGSPWGRGYMRATQKISSDDWFFKGHFKNDPCMPGTLMLEAGLQVMAVYLTGLGCTLTRDAWRFEPVPEKSYHLRCRGQVRPTSKEVVYEIFVFGFEASPIPTLHADLLGTVDGLKAFHTKISLRLVPDWLLNEAQLPPDTRILSKKDGFPIDYISLMACANGKPSRAFGDTYKTFDNHRRCARLPSAPYHFISRVTNIDRRGENGFSTNITTELELKKEDWFFSDSHSKTMPMCVMMESALQPCGWLACYLDLPLTSEHELLFRNLDGNATMLREILPCDGVLVSEVTCTSVSQSGGMILVTFDVVCTLGGERVYTMNTGFGYFPPEAFVDQKGLAVPEFEKAHIDIQSDFFVDLNERPKQYCAGSLSLPAVKLLMLDRVTGYWPEAGEAGLGMLRAEKTVDAADWFFKAHFFQDPVQPGSLGIQAMVQLVQFYMLYHNMGEDIEQARFEALATMKPVIWKYRGQVTPADGMIRVLVEIVEINGDQQFVIANASLWVDDKRIYEAKGVGMRIVGSQ